MTAVAGPAPHASAEASARPDRRAMLMGGAMLALGTPLLLAPLREERLLGTAKLDTLPPEQVGGWRAQPGSGLLLPDAVLGKDVYEDVVTRNYVDDAGRAIMLLIAYGRAASRQLTIHDPRLCYSAQGFTVDRDQPIAVADGARTLPATLLDTNRAPRHEVVLFWRRIGRTIPADRAAERMAYLRYGFSRRSADGALVRMSIVNLPFDRAGAMLAGFAADLVAAASPLARLVMTGEATLTRSSARP